MIRNGQQSPPLCLLDSEGVEHSLESFAGKPLVLLFFRGTFCPTSRKSLGSWQDFSRSVNDLGFGILAISSDTHENHREFSAQYSIKIPILSDPDLAVSKSFEIYLDNNRNAGEYGEPALFLVDAKGRIAFSIISSGPKGMPEPGAIASMLIFMSKRNGMY
jgi:peroxiredoxin